ncbi:PigN-domain-containing protein [Punctularia strigosozonata HHB-11173 SS5]|uniref:PigN-domain-containing protein n=1 Tax=Punctularia strigosozonata (strain HHB-11173) TaxID=741275 RepID=UPI000441686F|nr:PigN-domain-containing protein [Punctularia strigosozonata HHB-11173 SS5]EIN05765.1 PigN-domain-containing protein [Punctularia strigosozonata HHB-11173 SS5]
MGAPDSRSVATLLVIGLVFHLIYIGAVFDCYFTSPVVHGMKAYGSRSSGEAKRLVLVVGDGLRADLLLNVNPFPSVRNSQEIVAPYLRSVIETRGAWGISHTRVPTESRPGHVALIGGMYEDVSAVTKGWKSNPVDFDSVFNRSSTTFSFGSPDILPIFTHADSTPHIRTWCYDESAEDFTKDATSLDTWVLEQLHTLFANATTDPKLDAQVRGEKTVFFLHLLGLDTTGHAYRPHSPEYVRNIQLVDAIVRDAESLFSEYYGDNETAFVFTADHGMSRIGNHGDGDPDNTRTPLVAWGPGFRGPLPDTVPSTHDDYSTPFNLSHVMRTDVSQADIAPLMASVLGIDWPVNSVGVLPDVDPNMPGGGYLQLNDADKGKAELALVNAKVILEQYRVKHSIKKKHTLLYKPFMPLAADEEQQGSADVANIERLIREQRWRDSLAASKRLIDNALDGLSYLQTYDRTLIRSLVVLAYTGWMAFSLSFILSSDSSGSSPFITAGAVSALLLTWLLFAAQHSPWTFYVYTIFPCYFWHQALCSTVKTGLPSWNQPRKEWLSAWFISKFAVLGAGAVIVLQSMVLAYTHRSIWSAGFVIIGIIWPTLSWPREMWSRNVWLGLSWAGSCLLTSIFPLLSVDKDESVILISLGGAAMLLVGFSGIHILSRRGPDFSIHPFGTQMLLIGVTMAVTASSVRNLQAKRGLPLLNEVSGWALLAIAAAVPTLSGKNVTGVHSKILMYFLAFGPLFVLLSISVEGLFYVVFSITLALWIEVESAARDRSPVPALVGSSDPRVHAQDGKIAMPSSGRYNPRLDDVRIALFFLFFVQVAFFGTGNVASISSFYLAPVYRLVPIFSPFLMASLLIYKIIAPYVILAISFAVLNARLRLPPFSLFLVALTLTDVMTMTFFFRVTDTGSWLEIGQSITFFCISSLLLVWSAGICALGEYLMSEPRKAKTE